MKETVSSIFRRQTSILLSAAGALCFTAALLCLERTAAAGIFSTLGLILLLCGGRQAESRAAILVNAILLWLGHGIRFCGIFGTEFLYTLLCFLVFIPYCGLLAAALCLDRRLHRQGHPLLSVPVLPASYALLSYLLAAAGFGFVSNLMAYGMNLPLVAANLSLVGEYGLTFLLMLLLLCFAGLWFEPQRKMKITLAGISLLLSAFLLANGALLRSRYQEPDYSLKVALATAQEMDFLGESGQFYTAEQQIDMFSRALQTAAGDGADLLMLHEEYFSWEEENVSAYLEQVAQIVRSYGIPTLLCLEILCEEEPCINEAIYMDGDGQILYTYVKNNLVPFIEAGSYRDGPEEPALLNVTLGGHSLNLAFIICYDINDDAYLRKIPDSTELLLVPSWDWDTENIEQLRTACRSASLQLTLVKHSFDGFSFVSCPEGSLSELVDLRGEFETVTTVEVPIWEK